MTMKTILGISLAMVMLLGSVPLGFSEPLKVQLENSTEIVNLQCDNPSHVLVIRTNGNYACVFEGTAESLGWTEVFDNVSRTSLTDDRFTITPVHNNVLTGISSNCEDGWPRNISLDVPLMVKNGEEFEINVHYTFALYDEEDIEESVETGEPLLFENTYEYDTPQYAHDGETGEQTVICENEYFRMSASDKIEVLLDGIVETDSIYFSERQNTHVEMEKAIPFSESITNILTVPMVINEPLNSWDGQIAIGFDRLSMGDIITAVTYGDTTIFSLDNLYGTSNHSPYIDTGDYERALADNKGIIQEIKATVQPTPEVYISQPLTHSYVFENGTEIELTVDELADMHGILGNSGIRDTLVFSDHDFFDSFFEKYSDLISRFLLPLAVSSAYGDDGGNNTGGIINIKPSTEGNSTRSEISFGIDDITNGILVITSIDFEKISDRVLINDIISE